MDYIDKETGEWTEIWNAAYEMHYECFYQELCSEWLVSRWKAIDSLSKFLISVTASGSAISGWVLWKFSVLDLLWAILSGAAALISVLHSSLNISNRIEEGTLQYSDFKSLRIKLELFRVQMRIHMFDDIANYKSELNLILNQYGKIHKSIKPDFILIGFFRKRIQKKLNKLI